MKQIFTVILLLITLNCFAQKNDAENFPDTFYYKVIDTVTATKQQLYLRARQFVALNFKNSRSVIQMDDKDGGKIVCKGDMDIFIKGPFGMEFGNYVDFVLNIDVKDNKYRCILTDFYHDGYDQVHSINPKGGDLNNFEPICGNGMYGIPQRYWYRIKAQANKQAISFLASIKLEMDKPFKDEDF